MKFIELLRRIYHSYTWVRMEGREVGKVHKKILSIKYDCFIDKRADIFNHRSLRIGKCARINRGCLINYMVASDLDITLKIGDNCFIGPSSILNPQANQIFIGNNCSINAFCRFYGGGGLTIGDNTRIGSGTIILPMNHKFADIQIPIRKQGETRQGIKIGNDVWIGAGVFVLDGVSIGDGSVIGAGSIVTKNIPPYKIAYGVPAIVVNDRRN